MKKFHLPFRLRLFLFTCFVLLGTEGRNQNIGINNTGSAPASTNMLEVLQTDNTSNTTGIYSNHSGNTAGNTYYGLKSIADGTAGLAHIAAYLSSSGATNNYALIVPSGGGSVGIGTTSPSDLLHLSAVSNTNMRLTHTDATSAVNSISFYESATLYGFINQRGSTHAEAGQFNIGNNVGATSIWAGGANRIHILSGGNVGIGTTSPQAVLDVNASVTRFNGNEFNHHKTTVSTSATQITPTGQQYGVSYVFAYNQANGGDVFYDIVLHSTSAMVISSGAIGTNPSRTYTVDGSSILNLALSAGTWTVKVMTQAN